MQSTANQNPEQIARDKIDVMLREAGWSVHSKKKVDLSPNHYFYQPTTI